MSSQKPFILFLSGASGVGKTTILHILQARNIDSSGVFLHFDSIDVPSSEEMIEETGSLQRWQEITTHKWVEKIVVEYADKNLVVLEGQANPDFVEAACHKFNVSQYAVILIDCEWETMSERLINKRRQPELVNADMKNWANFLREQAIRKNIPVIDTSYQTPEEIADFIQEQVLANLNERLKLL